MSARLGNSAARGLFIIAIFEALPWTTNRLSLSAHINRQIGNFVQSRIARYQMHDMCEFEFILQNSRIAKVVVFPVAIHLPIPSRVRHK